MALYDDISAAVTKIIDKYKEVIGDGKLSFSEIISLTGAVAASFLELTKTIAALDADKKKAILAALDQFYISVIAPIDIPVIPNIIEPMVDAGLKEVVMYLAEAMLDTLIGIQAIGGSPVKYALAGAAEEHKVFLPAFLIK